MATAPTLRNGGTHITIDDFSREPPFDWGRTSSDYATHRPGPPASFYQMLAALGIGTAGQAIVDLGTGTGLLAREFARRRCKVVGIDVSPQQIAAAKSLVSQADDIEFRVAPAEATDLLSASFDAVTANQCWHYFDAPRVSAEVRRLLKREGVLVVSGFNWLPRLDGVAGAMEKLVLRFNPAWSGADWDGAVDPFPAWARSDFHLKGFFVYDEPIPFTRDSWRGRIRACRGTGATLPPDEIARFDAEHAALLESLVPQSFTVLHRIFAHVLVPAR
ncbi:MAG: class I SAM-dependent methyltransferase [Planctomycetota bacterium]